MREDGSRPAGIEPGRGAEEVEETFVFQEGSVGNGERALGLGRALQQPRGIGQERAMDEANQDLPAPVIEPADAAFDRRVRIQLLVGERAPFDALVAGRNRFQDRPPRRQQQTQLRRLGVRKQSRDLVYVQAEHGVYLELGFMRRVTKSSRPATSSPAAR